LYVLGGAAPSYDDMGEARFWAQMLRILWAAAQEVGMASIAPAAQNGDALKERKGDM